MSEGKVSNFFGRRKGKALRGKQADLMDTLLPDLALDLTEAAPHDLADLFPEPVREVWLESGFGGGEHLVHQATTYSDVGLIGIEPFVNGMAKAVARIEEDDLRNIRLHNDDAVPVLDWLPDQSIDKVFILYPDPWPKKKHWKRRFVSGPNLARIARVLKPGGIFRFASDIDTYVSWVLIHMRQTDAFEWLADDPADWRNPWSDWTRTRYEAKAIREGRTPSYLTFRRI